MRFDENHFGIRDEHKEQRPIDFCSGRSRSGASQRFGYPIRLKCRFFKIGMELMMTGDYFELLDWLVERDKKVFVDLKLFDVPATVSKAIKRLSKRGAYFTTIHGNQSMMEAAASEKGDLKVLAVTALTSLDRGDFDDLGFDCAVEDLVISRARRAYESGVDGIVASGLELPSIRKALEDKILIVTPESDLWRIDKQMIKKE